MTNVSTVETAVALARIEGKIDLQTLEMSHLRQGIADQKSDVVALNQPVTSLEAWKMKAIGVGMVVSSIISGAAWFISTFFGKA